MYILILFKLNYKPYKIHNYFNFEISVEPKTIKIKDLNKY